MLNTPWTNMLISFIDNVVHIYIVSLFMHPRMYRFVSYISKVIGLHLCRFSSFISQICLNLHHTNCHHSCAKVFYIYIQKIYTIHTHTPHNVGEENTYKDMMNKVRQRELFQLVCAFHSGKWLLPWKMDTHICILQVLYPTHATSSKIKEWHMFHYYVHMNKKKFWSMEFSFHSFLLDKVSSMTLKSASLALLTGAFPLW